MQSTAAPAATSFFRVTMAPPWWWADDNRNNRASRRVTGAVKPFTFLAVLVFSLVSLFQLARFLLGWPVSINGIDVPPWVSAVIGVVTATLAVLLARESRD